VRQDRSVRRALTDALRAQIGLLTKVVLGASEKTRREKAMAAMGGMVGALILARAVDDETFSNEILKAAAASLSSGAGSADRLCKSDKPAKSVRNARASL
jgi:TetR/AcrR family transcriptional repressor of nem operon